ncbi:hypothetical protein [Daejeonella sp.]|uniref:hypothetical protein n=1 Tax=Daejeonella sp. TaxID=2805397 RepID=UPI0030BF22EE
MATQIQDIAIDLLEFDKQNPRLVEFGFSEKIKEEELVEVLYRVMAVEEIILSMHHSGYFKNDPLIAIPDGKKFTVIEGNRRLAAIKVIVEYPKYEKFYPKALPVPTNEVKDRLKTIPVVIEKSRKDAWQFIGFKHVNGASKWNSFAKAEYIAQVHNDFGVSLQDVGLQIGDTNKTVQRLYQSLMVIEQAEKSQVFDKTDINAPRLYFSHLYTGLQYDGIRDFIGLKDIEAETKEPVTKITELGEVLTWLFGSKKKEIKSVIVSQNPDLRNFDAVIKSPEARSALRATNDLHVAFEISQPDDLKFTESLNEGKRALYKSLQYWVTGYDGDITDLKTAGSIANMADELYNLMEKKHLEVYGKSDKKTRITE